MSVSNREQRLIIIVLLVVVAGSIMIFFPKQYKKYQDGRGRLKNIRMGIGNERQLLALRDDYRKRDDDLRGELKSFPADKQVDAYWLTKLSRIADNNGLIISRKTIGKEVVAGNARELPVDIRDWKGSTEALVKFLYEVQSAGSSMDVRQVRLSTSSRDKVNLSGKMTIFCAYTRGGSTNQMDLTTGGTMKEENK